MAASNPTQLTPPRVPVIDDRTGAISREWYRFFLSLLVATQGTQSALIGQIDTSTFAASVDAQLNTLAQATESQPQGASADDVAVLQTQLQDLAASLSPSDQSFLAPMWDALQSLALTPSVNLSDINANNFSGVLSVDKGGTGAATLTGYVKGNGTAAFTASATIPATDVTNLNFFSQPTPNAQTATVTLTIANLLTGVITATSVTAVAFTLPTGTSTDAGVLSGTAAVDTSFDWYVINLGSALGAVTMTANTDHTYVGNATVAVSTSAQFRTRKTAANTYVTYRLC